MKGQRLYIRPLDSGDEAAIRAFLDRYGDGSPVPACGLLGKLVGDLVAVLAMEIAQEEVEITHLVVAPELRRKRIGRAMVDEAERIAASMERAQLVVAGNTADDFLRHTGFEREGERWIRQVRAGRTER